LTNQEFSDTFTTLLNSYATQAQFGEQASSREIVLDEYEKSVLLTQAQDVIIKTYFDGTLNQQGQGFDDSTRRQVDFSSLIKVATLNPINDNASRFDPRGIIYQMPHTGSGSSIKTKVLFLLNEQMIVTQGNRIRIYVVVPISYKEYDREMSKPYAQPLKKQAWRLLQNKDDNFNVYTELIPKFNIDPQNVTYKIRYVERPTPIILEDLPNGLEIDGVSTESSCILNPILHMDVLNKAVELALATRVGDIANVNRAANNVTPTR